MDRARPQISDRRKPAGEEPHQRVIATLRVRVPVLLDDVDAAEAVPVGVITGEHVLPKTALTDGMVRKRTQIGGEVTVFCR